VWLWRYVIGWTHQKQYKIGKEENPTVICVQMGLLLRGFYCFLKCFLYKNIFLFFKIYF
jgi:hypothetical protein